MRRRKAAVAPLATLAWETAAQMARISWYAPLVVAQRTANITAAGHTPSARQKRENRTMISEKQVAAAQVATSVWLATMQAQQRAWLAAWGAGRLVPGWQDVALTNKTARQLGRALSPVTRRVKSNAARLSRSGARRTK